MQPITMGQILGLKNNKCIDSYPSHRCHTLNRWVLHHCQTPREPRGGPEYSLHHSNLHNLRLSEIVETLTGNVDKEKKTLKNTYHHNQGSKKPDPGLCTSNKGRFLKVYELTILNSLNFCFYTFGADIP